MFPHAVQQPLVAQLPVQMQQPMGFAPGPPMGFAPGPPMGFAPVTQQPVSYIHTP